MLAQRATVFSIGSPCPASQLLINISPYRERVYERTISGMCAYLFELIHAIRFMLSDPNTMGSSRVSDCLVVASALLYSIRFEN